MPDHRTMPDVRKIVAGILQRIDRLERRLVSFGSRSENEAVFSLAGGIYASVSGPWKARFSARLVEVVVLLGTAGTTETIVGVYRNGILLDAISLAADQEETTAPFAATFGKDSDLLTVAITTAGEGAASLTVQCRFE